jgi:hypothetical protein
MYVVRLLTRCGRPSRTIVANRTRTERAATLPKRTIHARIPHCPDLDLGRGSIGSGRRSYGVFIREWRERCGRECGVCAQHSARYRYV